MAPDMARRDGGIERRRLAPLAAGSLATAWLLGLGEAARGAARDIGGSVPPLAFSMAEATDGRRVTAADFQGRTVMLYFGYMFCPDICPTTLGNLVAVLDRLGPLAEQARILFVTVDPDRDSLELLRRYTAQFSPLVLGLRGTPDELTALARRYRVAYSVEPASPGHPYEVTHSTAVYVFDAGGAARLLVSGMDDPAPDIAGTAAAIRAVIEQRPESGLLARLLRMM